MELIWPPKWSDPAIHKPPTSYSRIHGVLNARSSRRREDLADGEPTTRNNGGSTARGGDVISSRGIKSRLQHHRAISTASRGATELRFARGYEIFIHLTEAYRILISQEINFVKMREMIAGAIEMERFDSMRE